MATSRPNASAWARPARCFQSIGVTKDWRLATTSLAPSGSTLRFPINRRHQGLATQTKWRPCRPLNFGFPINRRHQGLATVVNNFRDEWPNGHRFPINRRHQGLATIRKSFSQRFSDDWFPINRRHQGLATSNQGEYEPVGNPGCQSIGVTKDWRQTKIDPQQQA